MDLRTAGMLAIELMGRYGLHRWHFRLIHEAGLCGRCCYTSQTIELGSEHAIVNPESEVRDTILHEIAHALTPGSDHGTAWLRKCVEIGVRPEQYAGEDTMQVTRRHLRHAQMKRELDGH